MAKVHFKKSTREDFRKYRDYLSRHGKTDGHKYQKYELDRISKIFKNKLIDKLMGMRKHIDSIFPKEYEYSYRQFKMLVDKKHHYVLFYKLEKDSDGEEILKVHKCIHSTELRKDLEKRGIEPRKGCDQSLLKDLETVYEEDDTRDKNVDELEKQTGKVYQSKDGPEGGYYIRPVDPKTHQVGVWRSGNIKEHLRRSKILKDLGSYISEQITALRNYLRS